MYLLQGIITIVTQLPVSAMVYKKFFTCKKPFFSVTVTIHIVLNIQCCHISFNMTIGNCSLKLQKYLEYVIN